MRTRLLWALAGMVVLLGAIVLGPFASASATGDPGAEMMAGHGPGVRYAPTPTGGTAPGHGAGHRGQSPYAGTFDPASPIRALTLEELDQVRAGAGMGLARAAELNGLPGPRHVLDLGADLQLTPEQRAELQALYDQMLATARETGRQYLATQEAFEADLRAARVSVDALPERVAEVNRLRGSYKPST
jgi:hypothetical protein